MLSPKMLKGNYGSLNDMHSIVISGSTAKALFGDELAMNKTVRFDNQHDLKVTGVLKDIPSNSSFQFKFLVPFSYLEQTQGWVKEARNSDFSWNSFQQFVKLRPGVSYAQVAAKIKGIEKAENNANAKNSDVILQPMKRWHLYSKYENGKAPGDRYLRSDLYVPSAARSHADRFGGSIRGVPHRPRVWARSPDLLAGYPRRDSNRRSA